MRAMTARFCLFIVVRDGDDVWLSTFVEHDACSW